MTNYNFDNLKQNAKEGNNNGTYKVSFFGLKDDGDSAIIRFPYSSPKEIEYATVHNIKIGNCYRNIICLADKNGSKCPLCEENNKPKLKFFIKLISYVKDEKGNIVPEAKTWERPVAFANELNSYYENYGDLSNVLFMLKRHGAKGSMQTTYSLLPLKAEMYPETIYRKDFSAFEGFKFNSWIIMDKTAEEMKAFLDTGEFPKIENKSENNTSKSSGENETKKEVEIPPVHTHVYNPIYSSYPASTRQPSSAQIGTQTATPTTNDPTINRPRRYTNIN